MISIGPGNTEYFSRKAFDILKDIDVVVGYKTYIQLVSMVIKDKTIVSYGMKKEIDRAKTAIDHAMAGQKTAIISSGDAGIYGMAGLVLEICAEKKIRVAKQERSEESDLILEIIPGIPALSAGASLLGAPLMHDFASISLSDLMTPFDVILNRITCAAKGDFVIVIYNPKSRKRDWQLKAVLERLLEFKAKDTPVGIVSRAMRDGEIVKLATLVSVPFDEIDMQTILIIGNSATYCYKDFMITPRGYLNKYSI